MTAFFYAFIFMSVSFCCFAQTPADTASQIKPAPTEQEVYLKKAQDYLNGISTLKAQFSEAGKDGLKNGHLWWDRKNNKISMIYKSESLRLLLDTKHGLMLIKPLEKDTSSYDVSLTPAALLLKDHITFKDVHLAEVGFMKDASAPEDAPMDQKNLFFATFSPKNDTGIKLTLVFKTYPMLLLTGWVLLDASGYETEVLLSQVQLNTKLSEELFKPELLEKETFNPQ